MARAWSTQLYLYQREIQRGGPVSLERSDFKGQQENSGKQDEEEGGILKYNSTSDDGDIPSLELEANSLLGRGSHFRRRIRFNSRIVFC